QDRSPRSSRRGFANRTGNQDCRKAPLRIFESGEQHAHVYQVKFLRGCLRQLMSERVHPGDGGVVGNGHGKVRLGGTPLVRPTYVDSNIKDFSWRPTPEGLRLAS